VSVSVCTPVCARAHLHGNDEGRAGDLLGAAEHAKDIRAGLVHRIAEVVLPIPLIGQRRPYLHRCD
jgi:hypothetical protein